jgi:hypothetical protein
MERVKSFRRRAKKKVAARQALPWAFLEKRNLQPWLLGVL